MRKEHVWPDINPHCFTSLKRQQKFSMNIWEGILLDFLVGPFILPDRFTEARDHIFLEQVLHILLQSLQLSI